MLENYFYSNFTQEEIKEFLNTTWTEYWLFKKKFTTTRFEVEQWLKSYENYTLEQEYQKFIDYISKYRNIGLTINKEWIDL